MKGLIVKGIGGFYYVSTDLGIIEAKGRGIFRKDGITLAVGDKVEVTIVDHEKNTGIIEKIYPRKNHFIRPPIANVDAFLVVFAADEPRPVFSLIDKFIIMAEKSKVEPIILINKCDLVSENTLKKMTDVYSDCFKVLAVSGKKGYGIDALEREISGKVVALAGPSGVGKSTILNRLIPNANMETGSISKRTKRGKHTTRHVEIFSLIGGGKIFDTPGFTSFDILETTEEELGEFYPEFREYAKDCSFNDCRHLKEPKCRVKEAVENGQINKIRYKAYINNLLEIRSKRIY